MTKKSVTLEEGKLKGINLHSLWLRERLIGEEFVDQNNLQRLYEPSLIDQSLSIKDVFVDDKFLNITFTDGVKGSVNIDEIYDEINFIDCIPQKKIWKKSDNLQVYDNNKIHQDKNNLIEMLRSFYEYGYVIIENTKAEENEVIYFAEKLGPVRTTNWGKLFNVVSKPNPNDLAYTALELKSHSDNPYRKPVPGIQLLHCIANESTGGDSSLVDGFSVAEYLKENHEDFYKILTQTNVNFKFTDVDVILENRSKLIELDSDGNFKQISFSGRLDYVPLLNDKDLETFYKARKCMYELCNSDQFKIKFRLSKGMIAMFDNLRTLHGRTKFDPNTGFRHLQGCYIDHDATEGKLRRLLK
ncbi:TauD/TfdA family dioxygenase [Pelagibacteraceae bacterium]|nr:TauD/TfdA family dioxygenase [Pelagibacteraceae bacterium]